MKFQQLSDKLLLPPVRPCDGDKKCLIIDLDETLVHSSFKVSFSMFVLLITLAECSDFG